LNSTVRILKNIPFLRVLLFFITGIVLDQFFTLDANVVKRLHLCSIAIIILFSFLSIEYKWKYSSLLSVSLLVYLVSLGSLRNRSSTAIHEKNLPLQGTTIIKVIEIKKPTPTGKKYVTELFQRIKKGWTYKGKGYVYTSYNIHPLKIGDVLVTRTEIKPIKDLHNPGEFNFKRYSELNGIFYSCTINNEYNWYLLGDDLSIIERSILTIRWYIINKLQRFILSPDIRGMAEAMLIGYKNDLDDTINQSYANAGVSHVIAISGMHLGVIYFMINYLFGLLFKKRSVHFVSLLITLPFLWMFSFVTGASASVMRSVIMYSFIILSNAFTKHNNALNSLLGAAFFMLAFQPDIMYDIGFQLSFAAVLSIVCFYAAIKKKVYVHNKLLKFGWELVAVSLSAQILTTPLIIYHFQKIASYSLLNNLLIVPLSTIALITEIALCLCPFEWLSIHVFTPVICKTITFMNSFTSSMNKVPFSIIETPVLEWYQVVLLTILAYCLVICFSNPGKVGFSMLLLITFAVSINIVYEEITRKEIHQIVLLRSSKFGCLVHRHGEQAMIYLSGDWKEHNISLAEQMHQLSKSLHIDEVDILDMGQSPKLIYPSSQTGAILLNAGALKGAELHKLLQKKSQLFVDGSTKLWKIRQWKKDPQNLHLRFLHTAEMGPIFLDCRDFHYRSVKNHFDAKKDPLSTHFGIL